MKSALKHHSIPLKKSPYMAATWKIRFRQHVLWLQIRVDDATNPVPEVIWGRRSQSKHLAQNLDRYICYDVLLWITITIYLWWITTLYNNYIYNIIYIYILSCSLSLSLSLYLHTHTHTRIYIYTDSGIYIHIKVRIVTHRIHVWQCMAYIC